MGMRRIIVRLCATLLIVGAGASHAGSTGPRYAVLAWNDLGMHCYNPDFSNLAILPPYNNLWAQVIQVADPPRIVTAGVKVEYSFVDNTYSVGKTNFWNYAQTLFGLPSPLAPNIGLKGKGLKGTMDPAAEPAGTALDHFVAEGIPLTEHPDHPPTAVQPFQLANITVKESRSATILARLTTVAPVSSELRCDNCHADGMDATMRIGGGTGKLETNILAVHDAVSGTHLMDEQPVLCARCHDSNALGTTGGSAQRSLSKAMHSWHTPDRAPDITPDTNGCYNCHPGRNTQCLRDTMSQDFSHQCPDCHGQMADVGATDGREPWLAEPRCDIATCHGAGFGLDQPLYRHSRGHGGIYCAGCHDSPHAVAPSREWRDSIKFVQLQWKTGTLRKCTVCHQTRPTQAFRHRWVPSVP